MILGGVPAAAHHVMWAIFRRDHGSVPAGGDVYTSARPALGAGSGSRSGPSLLPLPPSVGPATAWDFAVWFLPSSSFFLGPGVLKSALHLVAGVATFLSSFDRPGVCCTRELLTRGGCNTAHAMGRAL